MPGPLNLRPCPCCKTPPTPEADAGPVMRYTGIISPLTSEELGAIYYCVQCLDCGATVGGDALDETVALWNGGQPAEGG